MAQTIRSAQPAGATGFLHHKAGHEIPVRVRAVPVHNEHGSIVGAVEIFEDLQQASHLPERGEPHEQLPESLDPVTGTASRAVLELHLRTALGAFREQKVPFGLLLVRVEKLMQFRSGLGTEAAASFLRVVARTLEGALWITDFIGRWSDDHFLVILRGCQQEALQTVKERVRRTIAGEGIEWWGERRSLPVSIGAASVEGEDTVESLLGRVQKSLESASAWLTSSGTAKAAQSTSGSQ